MALLTHVGGAESDSFITVSEADDYLERLPDDMTVQKGFEILEELIQRNPGYIVYRYDLGIFHLRTGDESKARRQFEKVVSMEPMTKEGFIYKDWARWRLRKIRKKE